MRRAQGYLYMSRTHLKYDCTSNMWKAKGYPLLDSMKSIRYLYILCMRDIPAYNRF